MNDKIKRIDEFKNTNEFKTIQDLLDKYMDGVTSNEEEAMLRKYFEEHGNDIPEEWESYRALFSYIGFEQMNLSQILKEEEKEIEKEDILEDEEKNIPKKKGKEKETSPKKETFTKKEASRCRWLKYFGTSVAAAAIIAFLIVGIQKIAQPQPECYAVIDGKVYTDQEFVHNEALDALEDVSADSEDPFSALDMMKQ
ncbi:hypothetical protein F7D95_08920 [Prevotella copri]|uniref:Uncharacterized protein n=1 Tax=Segatella copri TaxID=165179 RepID=A0AA90UFR5_9BACT|nr:hypothetical protein [Segatella copri]MQN12942.1 hypothetical protein [Segatella copri]